MRGKQKKHTKNSCMEMNACLLHKMTHREYVKIAIQKHVRQKRCIDKNVAKIISKQRWYKKMTKFSQIKILSRKNPTCPKYALHIFKLRLF